MLLILQSLNLLVNIKRLKVESEWRMKAGKFNLDGTDPEDFTGSTVKKGIYTEIKERYSRDIFMNFQS